MVLVVHQQIKSVIGRFGGGQVVSVLDFSSDDSRSNPAEINKKEAGNDPFENFICYNPYKNHLMKG